MYSMEFAKHVFRVGMDSKAEQPKVELESDENERHAYLITMLGLFFTPFQFLLFFSM